jgi:Cd2+/Zn2+-exporting ATPase
VVALAVAIALVPPLALGWPLDESIYRALVLLVIACPCALVISTPVAIVSAIARAARDGVLIKGGAHLETLGAVRAVLIDKTGTLTLGRPSVVAVLPADQRDRLIGLAAAVEARSEHPFARAIVRYAQHEGIAVPSATGFEALPGRGARAELPEPVMVGSPVWLTADGVDLGPIARDVEEQEALGRSALVVAVARRAVGVIAVADQLRPHARLAVWELGRASIGRVVMLTGDNARAAAAVGAATGIGDVRSGLLPGDKVAAVRDAIGQHGRVAMLGDGVNDAPALAAASVGIAMGAAGSAAAIESADVALMGDELTRLPEAIVLARRVLAIIRQNVAISLLSKGVFLLLGVVGVAGLWLAVLADMGTSLLVTVNGMRLLRRRPSME